MILLVAGIAVALVSTEENATDVEELETWNIGLRTLNPSSEPGNFTFWGRYMQKGSWFELNVSASGVVRVTISLLDPGQQTMDPIFNQLGATFTQIVGVGVGGTYHMEIRNEGPTAVDVSGSAMAKREVTTQRTVYPHATVGTLTALGGVALVILGVFSRSARSRVEKTKSKSKATR